MTPKLPSAAKVPSGLLELLSTYATLLTVACLLYVVWPPQAPARHPPLVQLFGTRHQVREATDLHILHAGAILVILGLVSLTARLTGERYVKRWAFSWLSLLLLYAWKACGGLPFLDGLMPSGDAAAAIQFVLLSGGTVFISLTGIALRSPQVPVRVEVLIAAATVGASVAPGLAAASAGLGSFAQWVLVGEGAMAAGATLFAGRQLSLRAQRGFPGGGEILPIFSLYGLLQLGAPWLGSPATGTALFAAAFLLKLPCALSVVAMALRESTAETERVQVALRQKNTDLTVALEKAETTENAARIRRDLIQRLVALEERLEVEHALEDFLAVVLAFLNAQRGILYTLCEQKGERPQWAAAAMHGLPSDHRLLVLCPPPDTSPALWAVRKHLKEVWPATERELVFVPMPGTLQTEAWIVFEQPDTDYQLSLDAVTQCVDRGLASIQLVLSREVLRLTRIARDVLKGTADLRRQLDVLAKCAADELHAASAAIELTDSHLKLRHQASWPGQGLARPSPAPEYPTDTVYGWNVISPSGDVLSDGPFQSIIERPITDVARNVIGILRCVDKIDRVGGAQVVPFTPFDAQRLEVVADVIGAVTESVASQQNMEILIARSVHELRSPVGSLRNIVHWLERHLKPVPGEKLSKRLLDARVDIETLRGVVERADSRSEDQHGKPVRTMVFGDIVHKKVIELRERLGRLGYEARHVRIEAGDSYVVPTLFVPRSHLQQIIDNLMENAFKYRKLRAGTFRLQVAGDVDETHFRVCVRDWGIGVPTEWSEHIFLNGKRAPNAIRQDVVGMGMGLPLARQLSGQVGGRLELTRNVNPTEFTLFLPKRLEAR